MSNHELMIPQIAGKVGVLLFFALIFCYLISGVVVVALFRLSEEFPTQIVISFFHSTVV